MRRTVALGVALAVAFLAWSADAPPDWITVEYQALVDRRELTHSGEPVGLLLGRPGDAHADTLLEPVLERYAFVLPDAFDSMGRFKPRAELGRLWPEGGKEPAWVELLRARRYVVESDGAGTLRAFLPAPRGMGEATSTAAAEAAWKDAWPVLRHALAAERRRRPGKLTVEVYPYVHDLSGTRFRVGVTAWRTEVEETEKSTAPPLDLDTWTRFLERGMTLAGARLAGPGEVRLLGDDGGAPPTLLGRPLALADLAVAWRAVAHGGLAEPYMSLDRGVSPWTTRVSYGGRLRDTALGLVSLRCDVRFKTFSLGLAPDGNGDLRERLRAAIPGFRTHLERFADDASASGTWSQQTRLWFYPDDVELGLSASGDALVIARARMTAASERQDVRKEEDPPWTRETVTAINRDYAALAQSLPELHDLDEVVRVLALATWLQQARSDGLPVPDLDVLLDVELPAEPTPRTWPQILAVNGLPGAPGGGQVEVIERGDVGRALQRLDPAQGSLPARQRLQRALERLDPTRADHAALLRDVQALGGSAETGTVDLLAWRAERLAMHALVLGTLPEGSRARVAGKRLFSVGIGGLDLGMSRVLAKASRRGLDLRGRSPAKEPPKPKARTSATPLPAIPSVARFTGPMPGPGFPAATGPCPSPFQDGTRVLRFDGSCRLDAVERREGDRALAFRFEPSGTTWTARVVPVLPPALAQPVSQPAGLAVLTVARREAETGSDTVAVRLQGNGLDRAADLPRRGLQRLLLGQELAPAGSATLPGLVPPPPEMGQPEAWMVWTPDLAAHGLPGEEDPIRLADALRAASLPVVLGVGAEAPTAWARAPRVGRALLVVPEDAFPGVAAPRRDAVAQAWGKAPRATALPERKLPDLVVLVSAEAPAVLASRAAALASDPRLAGRHLAVLSLGGELPPALTADLLARGPAGVAVSAGDLDDLRALAGAVAHLGRDRRVETLPGLGPWTYGISGSRPPAEPGTPAPPSPSHRSRR
ncbi:MAG TPA: hypothetical protein VFO11_12765 [Candidatus Polarisedimenticolaceae bacterium]|nr:hypothetical protein [Candidatus Polarisedimenticolaceae bacterium]